MNNKLLKVYFTLVMWFLYSIAAFPEKKQMKTELRTFLFNKVWPVTFFWFWTPLVPMVTLKIFQYFEKKEWEDFLEITHMYFLGCNTLYMCYALQKTPKHFKNTMYLVQRHFVAYKDFGLNDFSMMILLWIILASSFCFYVLGSIYYGEVLVPVWIPFIDNDQPLPTLLFLTVWVYEGLAGVYMIAVYGFLSPFVIVSTMIIIKEINYLIKKMHDLKYNDYEYDEYVTCQAFIYNGNIRMISGQVSNKTSLSVNTINKKKPELEMSGNDILENSCNSESDSKKFVRNFVTHHQNIMSVIREVSKIHHYVFLTQALFTIFHSCFLVFNMYYTERLTKVIVKSSPILCLSYYLLYIYCWNGQRLTNTCEDLFHALYSCQWYNCPQSFKTSLIIMMQFCCRRVNLTGGGIFTASFETFLHGLQQSISYILLLKQLTPEKKSK